MAASFMVFFRSGTCDLAAAIPALAGYGLSVTREGDLLTVSSPGSPEFRVRVSTEGWVREEAAEIGAGTPHAPAMNECDARFEIDFDSLDEALDEINTLMEVEAALSEVSRGFVFLPWNGNLFRLDESQ